MDRLASPVRRRVTHLYVDPLDAIWIGAARRMGFRVERSHDVYASYDGRGTIFVGDAASLDADDCLAQIIFHEVCHSLVEGREGLDVPDFGLDNGSARDLVREEACLRAQAALAAPLGLRWVLAPTTDHRAFFDLLPHDPLTPRDAPAVVLARVALARATERPWGPHLEEALEATAAVCGAAAGAGPASPGGLPTIFERVEAPRGLHPSGLPLALEGDRRCRDCGWCYSGGRGRPVERCRQADGARVRASSPACERWEPALRCGTCGACCREAYPAVGLARGDPFVAAHPALVVAEAGRLWVAREGTRCAALRGDGTKEARFSCAVYDERPKTCRELELGGAHCLAARRRVGLSR